MTFTAVDLSRLPVPDVIETIDYEAVLAALRADLQARLPEFDAWLPSDPIVKLLEVAAYREMLLRQQFNDRARSVMLAASFQPVDRKDSHIIRIQPRFGMRICLLLSAWLIFLVTVVGWCTVSLKI